MNIEQRIREQIEIAQRAIKAAQDMCSEAPDRTGAVKWSLQFADLELDKAAMHIVEREPQSNVL